MKPKQIFKMAIRAFLEEYEFSGKTIIPFYTTLGAGVEESQDNIEILCPDTEVFSRLMLHTGSSFSDQIAEWLSK